LGFQMGWDIRLKRIHVSLIRAIGAQR
jgi:hypothetical protein